MSATTTMPPAELASRIGEGDYHRIGGEHARLIREMLPSDWTWDGMRVLDFGCGTGRSMVQFEREAQQAEIWGCDIDAPSIEWARQALSPPFHFVANGELPPVDLPVASFDLVYGISVFTHLVDTWSVWLLEVHRLLTVGGFALFSFLGEGMIADLVGREWDENRVGMVGLDVGRPWAMGGPTTLHSEWWLRKHWGLVFEVVRVHPYSYVEAKKGHGWILLRKDDRVPPTREELERYDPADPREIASLEFNLELLKERTAPLWPGQIALQRIIASKAWRLTAPLRRIHRAAVQLRGRR